MYGMLRSEKDDSADSLDDGTDDVMSIAQFAKNA